VSPTSPNSGGGEGGAPPAAPAGGNGGAPPAAKHEKPAWIFGEGFFDETKGVDLDKLGPAAKELFDFKSTYETEQAARKADTPEKPDDYGYATPEGYKLPEGMQIDEKSPLWGTLREVAHKRGLTNSEFKETSAAFLDAMAADQKQSMERFEAGKAELFKQLGDAGSQRVEAVKTWMSGFFGEKVGAQMQSTLFTPDIVQAFEKIQKTFTDQGVAGFSQQGRDGGRTDGKPDNWDSMSPVDKLVWQRAQAAQGKK